ncbi:uncharacterized protein [Primulina huaijiensis]|uniref:uncharacterized protein n=1 Tax=Primulina huaijiensis TaxID=1492673 RepID=UPI003CC70C5F
MAASIAALLRRKPSCKTFSSASTSTPLCLPHFKEVLLHDWWLIKADSDAHGKRLGVGGFTTESHGTRGFLSAPIVKRLDAVTLQATDGITITVNGHLNRSRTLNNGFPLKVCNDFVFGFPFYWEEFAPLSFDRLETGSENSEHVSLDALPITIQRDLFIGNLGHPESSLAGKNIFDDILQSTSAGTSNDGELGSKKASPFNMKSTVSTLDEALLNGLRSKAQRKQKGSKNARIAEPSTNVKLKLVQENNDVAGRGVLISGPLTRSRSRLIMKTA